MIEAIEVGREAVVAYRVAAHGLTQRAGGLDGVSLGAQDTAPGNGLLALAARVEGLDAERLAAAFTQDRQLVATWSLRGAIHVTGRNDLDMFTAGARPSTSASWRVMLGGAAEFLDSVGWDPAEATELVLDELLEILGDEQCNKPEVSTRLRERLPNELNPWCGPCKVHHVPEQLLRSTGLSGQVLFTKGGERQPPAVRRQVWLGEDRPALASDEAGRDLVRHFLHRYGPTTHQRFAEWTGMGRGDARRSFDGFRDELVEVRVEGREGWLHADDRPALEDAPAAAGARLLPAGDPLLQLRDRETLVPDKARRQRLWRPVGSPGLVLSRGVPSGVWRMRKKGKRLEVTVEAWERLSKAARDEIVEEAQALAPVRGCASATVAYQ